jgi:hypothetical protein
VKELIDTNRLAVPLHSEENRPVKIFAPLLLVLLVLCQWNGEVLAAEGGDQRAPERKAQRGESVLVLTSGRLVSGRISQSAGGYTVEKPTGRMVVPFDHVQVHAESPVLAYQSLREKMTDPSAGQHIGLARWCITNKLYDEARIELAAALELEPRNRVAQTTLKRIRRRANVKPSGAAQRKPSSPPVRQGHAAHNAESLLGLSDATVRQFTSRIQPILVNRCANSGCHNRSVENGFELVHVRTGGDSTRRQTLQNLGQAVKLVDTNDPEKSPLILSPLANHGDSGRRVLDRRYDAKIVEALESWAHRVAKDKAAKSKKPGARRKSLWDTRNEPAEKGNEILIRGRREPPAESADDAAEPPAELSPDVLLETKLLDSQADAFDPDVFNRRVHGRRRR